MDEEDLIQVFFFCLCAALLFFEAKHLNRDNLGQYHSDSLDTEDPLKII